VPDPPQLFGYARLYEKQYDVEAERIKLVREVLAQDRKNRRRALIVFYADDDDSISGLDSTNRTLQDILNNFYATRFIRLSRHFDWQEAYEYWDIRFRTGIFGVSFAEYLRRRNGFYTENDIDNIFRYNIPLTPMAMISDTNGNISVYAGDLYDLVDILKKNI
jgi:hypothetical protein